METMRGKKNKRQDKTKRKGEAEAGKVETNQSCCLKVPWEVKAKKKERD